MSSVLDSHMPPTPALGHNWRAHALPLTILTACWLAMILLVDPRGEFPLNDDWVYALTVKSVLETGYYHFPSPASANVGPQIYWGALFCLPFGFSFTALRVSTLVAGLVGVLAFYFLVRTLNGTRSAAVLCALLLAVNPLYFSQANTFMTDVPFVALSVVAMWFLVEGLQRESSTHLVIGFAVALTTVLVRQLGVVLILGYVVANLARNGWQIGRVARGIALVAAALMLHFGYQMWMVKTGRVPALTAHADIKTLMPTAAHLVQKAKTAGGVFLYVGFFMTPLMLHVWTRLTTDPLRRVNGRLVVPFLVALSISAFLALLSVGKLLPAAGNVLIPSGIGPLLLFDTYLLRINQPVVPIVAKAGWAVVTLFSIASILTLLLCLAGPVSRIAVSFLKKRERIRNWQLAFFTTIALAYFSILIMISGPVGIYDRYHILFLPLVVLMVYSVSSTPLRDTTGVGVASAASILVMCAFTICATHDFLAWSRMRWMALDELTARAVSPQRIDGGYEFNGWNLWHLHEPRYTEQKDKSWWWVVDNEYIIASGPLPNYVEVRRYEFSRWLFGTPSQVLTLRREAVIAGTTPGSGQQR